MHRGYGKGRKRSRRVKDERRATCGARVRELTTQPRPRRRPIRGSPECATPFRWFQRCSSTWGIFNNNNNNPDLVSGGEQAARKWFQMRSKDQQRTLDL